MTSLLELPSVRKQVHLLTVDDYHRATDMGLLSEDVELLRGIIVNKMAKSPLHEAVSEKLMDLLLAQIPPGFKVRPERPLTLQNSEPEPDLSVVKGKTDDWIHAHPSTAHLVIEVSITSEALDESKGDIYAEAGILEYWLVRPERRVMDIFRQPSPQGYRSKVTLNEKETVRCSNLPGVEFPPSAIFPSIGSGR